MIYGFTLGILKVNLSGLLEVEVMYFNKATEEYAYHLYTVVTRSDLGLHR